jgi:hypothetical protein
MIFMIQNSLVVTVTGYYIQMMTIMQHNSCIFSRCLPTQPKWDKTPNALRFKTLINGKNNMKKLWKFPRNIFSLSFTKFTWVHWKNLHMYWIFNKWICEMFIAHDDVLINYESFIEELPAGFFRKFFTELMSYFSFILRFPDALFSHFLLNNFHLN